MKNQLDLDNYLHHEKRICTLEAAIINIDKNMSEMKADIKEIKREYKNYFWGLIAGLGGLITFFNFIIPYFKSG